MVGTLWGARIKTFTFDSMYCASYLNELQELLECRTPSAWSKCLFSIPKRFGFDFVLFWLKKARTAPHSSAFVQTNVDPRWWVQYQDAGYYDVDPIVTHSLVHKLPLVWGRPTFGESPRQRELYEAASEHGLRSGISYPIHGLDGQFGLISFASNDEVPTNVSYWLQACVSLTLLRDYVFESALRFHVAPGVERYAVRLTPRELECLKWIALGKTSWEISKILMCAEVTINFHVSNLMKKLMVQTRQQAVAKGIRDGLISPL